MSQHPEPNQYGKRTLACPRCGTAFTCSLSGECWCDMETARLPMPASGEDCLCRECLRAAAAQQSLSNHSAVQKRE